MQIRSEADKYTLYGVLGGAAFPVCSILFLYFIGALNGAHGLLGLIPYAHHSNPLLFVIDTAPLFLGAVARIAGRRQDRIRQFADSLEQQVYEKTKSLQVALSESQKANELIKHMADHDTLTGLLNRRRFQETLEGWMKYAARYKRTGALLFLDVDKFKFVNDHYGHSAGDLYLTSIAYLLSGTLRATDIIGRWGGDEFVAFLPEQSGLEAQHVANKLIAAFALKTLSFGTETLRPSASIGMAFVSEHHNDMQGLVMCADAAMYEAKKAGRGRWRLYGASAPEMEHVQAAAQWESRIRRALDNDQFVLLYQPMLNLKTGRTDGYEALLRMEDREGQLISPGIFLEPAERANLSAIMDLMVIRKTARRMAQLSKPDQDIWVSINLTNKTMQSKDLPEQIELILQKYPGRNQLIRFEISESTVLQNLGLTRDIAAQISASGCSLILDDFGMGPASMQHLENLAIQMVKIHPGLSRKLMEEVKTRNFIKNQTEMLHGLNLDVAVKSIEDVRMLDILRDIGVDYAQGFAIGRPLESIECDESASASRVSS